MTRRIVVALAAAGLLASLLIGAGAARATVTAPSAHHPLYMPNAQNMSNPALQPPPVYTGPVGCVSGVGCVLPPPPAGEPAPVNMAYFGGHVQVTPKIYLVLWGWGEPGAFDHTTAGMPTSDPDGAGARMLAFIKAIGGTGWMGSQTQYYETVNGQNVNIQNPSTVFGGVWYDNTNDIVAAHNDAGGLTGLELAQEAQRAVAHFGITDLANSQIVVAQPQKYSETGFEQGVGYCAWHDYTQPQYYPGVQPGISFTNMPYVLDQGSSCGENQVNTGTYTGRLDGFTIVMGHEIEETITDPGAEDVVNGVNLGGWYDFTGYENGDKCAWVGSQLGLELLPPGEIPGGMNNITGSDGNQYPVQSLWSNGSAGGAGYCAGAGNDLPA
jgi:serine protease